MHPPSSTPRALGAILAGGLSRRFGAPKALAQVAGVPMVERVRRALEAAGALPVLVGERPELAQLDLPRRADAVAGGGPLAGLHTALLWARELGMPGALCLACDMPLVPPALLAEILELGLHSGAAAVAPRRAVGEGLEPLCAWYSVAALAEVETRLQRGERALHRLLAVLPAEPVPDARVLLHGAPESMLLNVNTVADHQRAERIARPPEDRHEQA